MKKFTKLLLVASVAVCGAVQASVPSSESVDQWIEVMKVEAMAKTSLAQGAKHQAVSQGLRYLRYTYPSASEEDFAKAQVMYEQGAQSLMDQLLQETDILAQLVQINREMVVTYYTQEEVDAMIAFYGSDLGQGILGKKDVMTKAVFARAAALTESVLSNTLSEEKYATQIAQLHDQIQSIFCPKCQIDERSDGDGKDNKDSISAK